jgi:hypothetical protein
MRARVSKGERAPAEGAAPQHEGGTPPPRAWQPRVVALALRMALSYDPRAL